MCRAAVLKGLDDDRCALAVFLDVGEVDKVGEVLAILQGRRTYDLMPYNKGAFAFCIRKRNAYYIGKPRRHSVVIEHKCDAPAIQKVPGQRGRAYPDDPPF